MAGALSSSRISEKQKEAVSIIYETRAGADLKNAHIL